MARSSRQQNIHPMALRSLTVESVVDVTPNMRRIVLGGEQFHRHRIDGIDMPELISTGFDDDVRLIFPDPVTGDRPYPQPIGDGRLRWTPEVKALFRAYTVRDVDSDNSTITIDFARHGLGVAEAWSEEAQPGQQLWVVGPKNCGSLPTHRDWLLLVGDETALPAISRCLEMLPEGFPTYVFVEVPTPGDIQAIATAADVELTWLIRERGEDYGSALSDWTPPAG